MPDKSQTYLTTLTPLRGIAALLVVIFHCNIMFKPWLPGGYTEFVMNGWLMVDLFFVLSGFIMSYVYSKYFSEKCTWKDYKKFIGARFARVYPLYFVTTMWAFLCAVIIVNKAIGLEPFLAVVFNPKSLPQCLLLIQSLHIYSMTPLNLPAWSLSVEWWVYMIFPLIVPVFARLRNTGKILMLLFIIGFFVFLRYIIAPISVTPSRGHPTLNISQDWGLLRCLAGFFLGMLSFEVYKTNTGFALLKKSWCFILFLIAALACMHFGVMDIITIFIFPFIILTAAHNNTSIKRFLDTRILQRLGDWSFSIYLIHVPIFYLFFVFDIYKDPTLFSNIFKPGPPPDYKLGVIYCLIVVVATITIASLTYRFIEIPARNYLNNAFKTKAKQVNVVSVEV